MGEALRLSLEVLAVDVPLMILLGVPLGWLLARKAFPGRKVLELFVLIPVVLPPSVLGLYLLLALGQLPGVRAWRLLFSFPALILGALIPALPLVVQGARAGFSSVSRDLEDAARTLGDSEWRVFFRITLPLARRSLGAGLALGTARALGEFGVSLMIAGNIPGVTQTLPLYIYSRAEALDFAAAHGAALILAAVGVATLIFVRHLEEGRHDPVG